MGSCERLLVVLIVLCSFTQVLFADRCGTGTKQFDVTETTLDGNVINVVYLTEQKVFVLTDAAILYQSTDSGDTWLVLLSSVVQIYPNADNSALYVTQKSNAIWVFKSSDNSITQKQTAADIRTIQPSPEDPNFVAMITNKTNQLYISDDQFTTWYLIDSNTYYGDWGYGNSFYYNCFGALKVVRNIKATSPGTTLMSKNSGILAVGHLLFVAMPSNTSGGLILLTSAGLGQGPWHRADFPTDGFEENHYTILDVSVGSVVIGVLHDDPTSAHIYMSDTNETSFALALKSVRRKPSGHVEFKLLGIDGILLANRYSYSLLGGGMQTVISYDNGGKWQYLPLPDGTPGNRGVATQLHISDPRDHEQWGPLKAKSTAVGLILGNGNVGQYVLDTPYSETATFFSRNVGQSWQVVQNHATDYDFGDHGAIMMFVDNSIPTTTVQYSWNEGLSTTACTFSDNAIDVDDLHSSPEPNTQNFLLYGKRSDGSTAMFHFDFSGLHEAECKLEDYEDWSVNGDKCLLGQKVTYTRRKQGSECYNPSDYEIVVKTVSCPCTMDDYECDECYERNDKTSECVKNSTVCAEVAVNCSSGVDHFYLPSGYRLVPGTQCDVKKGKDLLPRRISCTEQDSGAKGAVVGVVVTLFVLAVVAGAIFIYKNERSRRWLEDRIDWVRTTVLNKPTRANSWENNIEYLDSDNEADAPILNDEAIVHFDEKSSPVV